MKDMMMRCLSLGFSWSVVFLAGRRRNPLPVQSHAPQPKSPVPIPVPPPPPPAPPELPALSSFNGTVVRDGSRFALREPDGTLFALDSTGRAWPFEGEEVTIIGYFNLESKLLHISAIEAIDDLRAEAV